MAKKKKSTKVLKRQVMKSYKKNPKTTVTLLIVLVLCVGVFIYLYSAGYLDKYFNDTSGSATPVVGSFEQDENGFYYYNLTGYESGQYYYSAKDLSGNTLKDQLHNIVNNGFTSISYGDARYVLSFSDRDPKDNNASVRGIYDNDIISTEWIGTGEGAWQREHVWPNSKLGIPRVNNSSKNQGSDLHNLRAITGINQSRSNRYFDKGSGEAVTVGSEGFYPGDEHKGDVARILFYMDIMYEKLSLTNDILKLENNPDTNYTYNGAYAGILDLLIEWHKEDPVDDFEIQRNEFIYSGTAVDPDGEEVDSQGNRNPFIDKPEYVHLIWEDKEIEDLLKEEEVETNYSIPINNVYYVKSSQKNKWFS